MSDIFRDRLEAARVRWGLTRREVDVLRILGREGASNMRISVQLRIKECTVEQYVSRIFLKSGAVTRAELVARFWSDPLDLDAQGAGGPRRRTR